MLKFRPIAPKPPAAAAGALIAARVSDRAATAPMMKRRRGGRKPKKITTEVKKETGAVVTVEKVTEVGAAAAATAAEEMKRRLEADASPCFVSDSADRVTWINEGFRRMVLSEESSPSPETRVELVTRGTVPGGACVGFTCVARVRRGKVMMVVPCDVWRVVEEQLGKWAWRLDVATALDKKTVGEAVKELPTMALEKENDSVRRLDSSGGDGPVHPSDVAPLNSPPEGLDAAPNNLWLERGTRDDFGFCGRN